MYPKHYKSKMVRRKCSHGFISVGAVCQRLFWLFCVWVEGVVLFVLRLNCLVKRKEALRGRNLSRDSRASSAPMVHPASDVTVASEAVFLPPIGHPNHASKNPSDSVRVVNAVCLSYIVLVTVITLPSLLIPEAESYFPSSVAEAVRRGG